MNVGNVKAHLERVVVGKRSLTVGEAVGLIVALILMGWGYFKLPKDDKRRGWVFLIALIVLIVCMILF